MEDGLANFMSLTGLDAGAAKGLLEACGNNVQTAVTLHFDTQGQGASDDGGGGGGGGGVGGYTEASSPHGRGSNTWQTKASIKLDIGSVCTITVEEKPKTQQLVASSPTRYRGSNGNANRMPKEGFNLKAKKHAEAQEQQQQAGGAAQTTMTLGKLFAPPIDLIEPGTLAQTQEKGTREGKWIIVNLQKIDEFEYVWKNPEINALVSEKFLFWQRQHDTPDAEKYIQYYKRDSYPHIAILDPATETFIDQLWSFLDTNKLFSEFDGNSSTNADEEKQLAAAMRASLKDAAAGEVAKVEVEPVLAPEPAADSAEPVCTIRFVFPDNAKVQRRFLLSEMVWSLYLFVHAQGHRHEIHDLVFGYPKKILDKESAKDVTLESMKMKRETVHVQTIDL
eukprot:gene12540-33121_t